jgi:hypothetical protein
VQPREELAQLTTLGRAKRCQEPFLLLVEDPDGPHLGLPAGIGRADQERPPVTGMPLPDHEAPVFEVIDERDHGRPVHPERVAERLLGHRLQLGHQRQDPGLAGGEPRLGKHPVRQRVRGLGRPVEQERHPVAHGRRQPGARRVSRTG